VRRPPSKEGGRASITSSNVTSERGFRMRVLNEPPMRDSSRFGRRGCGKDGTWLSSLSFGSVCASRLLVLFFLLSGLGNTTVMAVSSGTQPGCLHETCITMTAVPSSRAFSGMVDSMYSMTRRLCCRSTIFSLAENMMAWSQPVRLLVISVLFLCRKLRLR